MQQNLKLGALLVIISTLAYAILGAIVKHYDAQFPPPLILFIQNLTALILITPIVLAKGKVQHRAILHSPHKIMQFFRAFFSLAIGYFFYYSLRHVSLSTGVLLLNTSPLIVPFIALIFLHKPIQHRLWLPMIIGFVGVAVVLHPKGDDFNIGAWLALGGALSMGCSILLGRRLAEVGQDSFTNLFYYFFYATIMSGIVAIFFWEPVPANILWIMIGTGVIWFAVQYTLVLSMNYLEAQIVLTLYYANVVFAVLLSIIFWHIIPNWLTWLGMLLIVAGGTITIQVQHRINQQNTLTNK
jgi:drug/metabolite transporter (DMT)-like permease